MEFVSRLFDFLVYTFYLKHSKPVSAFTVQIAAERHHLALGGLRKSHDAEVESVTN